MNELLEALEVLHEAKPDTYYWSVRFFSDGSGELLDQDRQSVSRLFENLEDAIQVIKAQIDKI